MADFSVSIQTHNRSVTQMRGSEDLIQSLNRRIDAVLKPLLPPRTRCALLDFPTHINVGDNAIWLGEKAWLKRNGVDVVYSCDLTTYSRKRLAATLGHGTLLLHGGGNLGDLYPNHQQFREQIIRDFPNNPIIQFSQSLHFQSEKNVQRAQSVFNRHSNFTLLVRTQRSLDRARKTFKIETLLCPDMAFAIGALERPQQPRKEVLWLLRKDVESAVKDIALTNGECERADWLTESPTTLHRINRFLTRRAGFSRGFARLHEYFPEAYDLLAKNRLAWGYRILSRGKVVITDRVHGHILSLLLGIPNVLLDNSYGKVKSFYDTWTKGCELTRWADSPEEAFALAKAFISSHHGES